MTAIVQERTNVEWRVSLVSFADFVDDGTADHFSVATIGSLAAGERVAFVALILAEVFDDSEAVALGANAALVDAADPARTPFVDARDNSLRVDQPPAAPAGPLDLAVTLNMTLAYDGTAGAISVAYAVVAA